MELTAENTSRMIRTATWNIHYSEAGAEPGRQVVIMLHGSGPGASGWSNFKGNIPTLAQQYHVIALDTPGWGKSDPVLRADNDQAKAVVEVMDALGIDRAAVIGNSMGGITSLRLAIENPDRITHLITMGPGSGTQPKLFSPGGGLSEGMKILVEGYRNPTTETMKRLVEVMTYDSARWGTDELAAERAAGARANPAHLKNYLEAFAQGGPIPIWFKLEDLPKIQAPTLLIHGRDDRVVHYENSLLLCASIPNSRLILLNRCGHWAQVEHAEEFNRLVIDFIDNN